MVVRPNKAIIDQATYQATTTRWAELWPNLTVIACNPDITRSVVSDFVGLVPADSGHRKRHRAGGM